MSDVGSAFSDSLSGLGSSISSGLSNIGNFFTGGGSTPGAPSGQGGIGSDAVAGGGQDFASNFVNDIFQSTDPTGSQAATQAITPPAQAAQAAQSGQDPSAGAGGVQTGAQVASTGPSGNPNQANQNDAEADQRQRSFDELRKEIKRRQKHLQSPWTIGAAQAQPPGVGRGPAGQGAGLYSPNISPDAAVRAGLLDPSLIDPATGQRRDPPPAPDELTETPPAQRDPTLALPEPSGATGAGQVVPRGGGAVVPPRTVPGTPGAPSAAGGPSIAGLLGGGLGGLASRAFPWFAGPLGAGEQILWNTTPAETGELPPYKGPSPEDYPDSTNYPQAQPGQPQPPYRPEDDPQVTKPKAADPKKAEPKKADKPRQVWVPETPGHYVPTTGNARGPATWVRGTPGHYETVGGRQAAARAAPEGPAPAQASPPAANQPDTSVPTRKPSEAAPGAPMAYGGPMAGTENMSPMLRDMLGIALPVALTALAGGFGRGRAPIGRLGGLGGFGGFGGRFPRMFRGGPLNPGYYPHRDGGIAYHPGGYHPGWGGQPRQVGALNQPRQAGPAAAAADGRQVAGAQGNENQILGEVRRRESGGRYDITPQENYMYGAQGRRHSEASGAYQFQPGTWRSVARMSGDQEAARYPEAYLAPPEVQDRMALWLLRNYGANSTFAWGASAGNRPYPEVAGGVGGGSAPPSGQPPPAATYTGSDQPADINADVG